VLVSVVTTAIISAFDDPLVLGRRASGLVMHIFFIAAVLWNTLLVLDLALRSKLITAPPMFSTIESRAAEAKRNSVILACIAWGIPAICALTQTIPTGCVFTDIILCSQPCIANHRAEMGVDSRLFLDSRSLTVSQYLRRTVDRTGTAGMDQDMAGQTFVGSPAATRCS
jgi:hypothetical protein